MSRPNSGAVLGFLIVTLAVLGGVSLLAGGFFIGKHEGDTLHLLEILFRMEAGERPHQDFMTPIGFMAFAPFVALLDNGLSVAQAIFWGQIVVGLCLLPAAWWVGVSRLSGIWPYVFGLLIMVFAVALVHGEAQRSASISMHYNRWAWAAAFLAITTSLLPPRHRNSIWADGWLIGAACAFLALSKVTYFAAFFPPILLALILRRQWRVIAIAMAVGAAAIVATTLVYGVAHWATYLGDMLAVSASEVRAKPGEPFSAILGAPKYIGGSLLAVLSVILLRQGKQQTEGLVLLVLLPGFFYVTYQNFGNDPQWLMVLAVLLFATAPATDVVNGWGWNMRQATQMAGVAAIALSLPTFFNMAYSPFRHYGVDQSQYTALLPNDARHDDLKIMTYRAYTIDGRVPLDGPEGGLHGFVELTDREETGVLNGATLTRCALDVGMTGWYQGVVDDLTAQGYAGSRIMVADLFSSLWLFGDFGRLEGGAPWFYGGLPGYDSADYILVPTCPLAMDVRKAIIKNIEERGDALTEVYRSSAFILLRKSD